MLSKSSLKIVLAGIFQFDIPLVPLTKDNPSQSICNPYWSLWWNPTLCGTQAYGSCCLQSLLALDRSGEDPSAQQLPGFSLAALYPLSPWQRKENGFLGKKVERVGTRQCGHCLHLPLVPVVMRGRIPAV